MKIGARRLSSAIDGQMKIKSAYNQDSITARTNFYRYFRLENLALFKRRMFVLNKAKNVLQNAVGS